MIELPVWAAACIILIVLCLGALAQVWLDRRR